MSCVPVAGNGSTTRNINPLLVLEVDIELVNANENEVRELRLVVV